MRIASSLLVVNLLTSLRGSIVHGFAHGLLPRRQIAPIPVFVPLRRHLGHTLPLMDHLPTDPSPSSTHRQSSIIAASFLVAGTTIGGGFLALPSVVATTGGFFPSAAALIGVWAFLLANAWVLVECLEPDQGVAGMVRSVLGSRGEWVTGILLVILTEATLVSQISRAGSLSTALPYPVGCSLSALVVATLVFSTKGIRYATATLANFILTSVFLVSALGVAVCGVPRADWTMLAVTQQWKALPKTLPVFLQLLVYGEIIPTVFQILKHDKRKVKTSIIYGSFLTLLLQIGWAALGTVMVMPSAANLGDPVAIVMNNPGPLQKPLICLALSAILTTILGSYLALSSAFQDLLPRMCRPESLLQRVLIPGLVVIPATIIASSSPSLFLRAIDFAGSYPVLLLWGVIPSVVYLTRMSKNSLSSKQISRGIVVILGSISMAMVGWNIFRDMAGLWGRI